MTITVVTSTGQGVINGNQMLMTFGTIADGDVAVVACALTRTGITHSVLSSGGTSYTQIVPTVTQTNLGLSVWARRLSSFETICTASGTGNNADADSSVVAVLRGVTLAGRKTSSGAVGSGTTPNSPAVTVGSTNAIVLSIAAGEVATTTPTVTAIPSGYSSAFNAGNSDTNSSRCAISTIIGSEQTTEDPAAYTFSATSSWIGVTVAFFDSASVYFPMADQLRDPPEIKPAMIPYGYQSLSS